jgi:hypothetical protein
MVSGTNPRRNRTNRRVIAGSSTIVAALLFSSV